MPPPILFNLWKHHAGAIRRRIRSIADAGDAALQELPGQLCVIGSELMDVYHGTLEPRAISEKVVAILKAEDRLSAPAYQAWLAENNGYQVVTLCEDDSAWVLRRGDETGRFVHLHPGRRTPLTRRVRANVLKTASARRR